MRSKALLLLILVLVFIAVGVYFFKPEQKIYINDTSYSSVYDSTKYQDKAIILVYFKSNVNDEEMRNFGQEVAKLKTVNSVKIVTKEQEYAAYLERYKNEPILTESVKPEMLSDTLSIFLNNVSEIEKIEALAKSKPFVEKVITPPASQLKQ